MANFAKYFPPLHNLPVFNPDEFPTTDPRPISVKGLITTANQVATNGVTIEESTTIINNWCKLYTTTLPSTTFKTAVKQTIAYSGGTVPNGVPFTLILNLNLGTTSNSVYLYTVTVELTNVGFPDIPTATWTNTGAINQTRISPQFVFTGKGNGNAFTINFTAYATSSSQNQIQLNPLSGGQSYVGDLMMYWL